MNGNADWLWRLSNDGRSQDHVKAKKIAIALCSTMPKMKDIKRSVENSTAKLWVAKKRLSDRCLSSTLVRSSRAMTTPRSKPRRAIRYHQQALRCRRFLEELRIAATDWGFFYVTNHGVSENEIDTFRSFMRAFFALPKDVKNLIRRTKINSRGYFDDELTKQQKDWKEVFDFGGAADDAPPGAPGSQRVQQDQNRWLEDETLPGFCTNMLEHYDRAEFICHRLMTLFSLILGKESTSLNQFFQNQDGKPHTSSVIRLNHYPVSPEPEKTTGVYHHTDGGVLTLLLQDDDVNSLQVFHRASRQWHFVPPRKNTFVVNIGDMLQIWSNDRFQAALHRVRSNGEKGRFSAPFFYRTRLDAPHYRPLTWHEFVRKRIEGNYADLGEEVQITQYRI